MREKGDMTPKNQTLAEMVAGFEKEVIHRTLMRTNGRKAETAQLLGIERKRLWEKMKAYELDKKDYYLKPWESYN